MSHLFRSRTCCTFLRFLELVLHIMERNIVSLYLYKIFRICTFLSVGHIKMVYNISAGTVPNITIKDNSLKDHEDNFKYSSIGCFNVMGITSLAVRSLLIIYLFSSSICLFLVYSKALKQL